MDKYKIVGKLRQLFFGSMAVVMSAGGVVATNMANAFAADQSLDNNVGVAARKLQYDDTESYVSKNVNKKVVTSEADKSTKEIKNDLIEFVDDLESVDLEGLGPLIENHPVFPERINVHFVEVLSPSEIDMVTWERGVGPTLACGTGATATVIAGKRIGKLDDKVLVHLPGGELKIQTYKMGNKIGAYMEGDAILVFDGILSW